MGLRLAHEQGAIPFQVCGASVLAGSAEAATALIRGISVDTRPHQSTASAQSVKRIASQRHRPYVQKRDARSEESS